MARPHTNKPRSPFARRLIQVRESFGVSTSQPGINQEEFADLLGVGSEAYRRYERGETQPKLNTLVRLRRLTGTSLDWLLTGASETTNRPTIKKRPSLKVVPTQGDEPITHS